MKIPSIRSLETYISEIQILLFLTERNEKNKKAKKRKIYFKLFHIVDCRISFTSGILCFKLFATDKISCKYVAHKLLIYS